MLKPPCEGEEVVVKNQEEVSVMLVKRVVLLHLIFACFSLTSHTLELLNFFHQTLNRGLNLYNLNPPFSLWRENIRYIATNHVQMISISSEE